MIKKGFTLVELLVVISIIGVLAGLALVSFVGTQKQARDTQRKSDLKQYATALETYASKNNGVFPQQSTTVSLDSLCTSSILGMTGCPIDPKKSDPSGTFDYKYQSDGITGGSPGATRYVLWAKLENTSNYWVVCSNGKVGQLASGFIVTSGTCPL